MPNQQKKQVERICSGSILCSGATFINLCNIWYVYKPRITLKGINLIKKEKQIE